MPSVMTRVSLIPPSCTVPRDASRTSPGSSRLPAGGKGGFRHSRRADPGEVQDVLFRGLRHGHRARTGRGLGLARLPRPGPAATPSVHDQAGYRIGHAVEGRADRRKGTERLPLLVGVEEHLEHYAVTVLMPLPVGRAARYRRLDELVLVGLLPPASRQLRCVEDLD